MGGTGKIAIAAGGVLNIDAGNVSAGYSVYLGRALENNGTATWNSGYLRFAGGTITNNGSFTANSNATLYAWGDGGVNNFNNTGTFTQAGTGNTTFTTNSNGVAFNNSGTVAVQAGSLTLLAGGTHTGIFSATASTSVNFGGTHIFQTSNTFTGPGSMNLTGGNYALAGTLLGSLNLSAGNLTISGAVNATNFAMSGGTLTGDANMTVTGALNWTGGVMGGTGKITIAAGGVLNIDAGNSSSVYLGRALENNGTATWNSGNLRFGSGTITNNGSFTANSNATLQAWGEGGVNNFNNAGTFTQAGTGNTYFTTQSNGVAFNNSGTVAVQAGSLTCVSYIQTTGITNLCGGSLSSGGTININGGILSGAGTINASVLSNGLVSPGTPLGTMTINGNYTQTSTGVLNIELGGATASNQIDCLVISGLATLSGTVQVRTVNSYQPAFAQTFFPVTFGSRNGMFSFFDAPVFGDDLTFNSSLTATTLSLAVVHTAFGNWKQTKFGADASNPAITGAMSDPNLNGTPNLLEFAFGMEPLLAGEMNKLPGVTKVTIASQDYLAIRFRRLTGVAPGVSYTVQESSNLTDWLAIDLASCQVGAAVNNGDGTETITVRSTMPMHGAAAPSAAFLRVAVSGN